MESWFLADRAALISFYGQYFNEGALPGNPKIEQVPATGIVKQLENATRKTQKGLYSKGSHSFDILGTLDPARVENVSPHAKRFLDALRRASS